MQIRELIPLRKYCRQNRWPTLPQWQYWISDKKPIAQKCIKKIGSRYVIDLQAFEEYIANASLEE